MLWLIVVPVLVIYGGVLSLLFRLYEELLFGRTPRYRMISRPSVRAS